MIATLQAGNGGINTAKLIAFRNSATSGYTITGIFDSNGNNSTLSGQFVNQGSGSTPVGNFIKTGLGQLTINSSSASTASVGLAANAGTLELVLSNMATPTNLWLSTQALTMGGGTLILNGKAGSIATAQTFSGLSVNAGGPSAISLVNNGTSDTMTLTSSTITRATGGTLNFIIPSGGTVVFGSAPALSDAILGPWATYSGTSYATINGSSDVIAYSGSVAATAVNVADTTGTANFDLAAGETMGNGGGALATSATFNTLRYLGAGDTVTGAFSANGLMNAGSGTLTMTGPVTIGSTKELVIAGVDPITLSGGIGNNGANASTLTYSGGGLLTLQGANTYTGSTVINSGTVQFGGSSLSTSGITINGAGRRATGLLDRLGRHQSHHHLRRRRAPIAIERL